METYYKVYYSAQFDGTEEPIAFVIVTDGEQTQVGYPYGTQEETIESYNAAIAARLNAIADVDKVTDTKTTPIELLQTLPYNMTVNYYEDEIEDEPYSSFDDALKAATLELEEPDEDEEPKFYDPRKEIKPVTAAVEGCPPATQDIAINLKNRKNAIDVAMYGPLNPDEPNEEYWQKMAGEWGVDAETAKKQRCGNCAVFVVTTEMRNCIAQGIEQGGSSDTDAWDAIGTAELGYCEAFDFKCAASRTCRAWVTGGPLDDSKKEQ